MTGERSYHSPAGWGVVRFEELWTLSQNGCGARRGVGTPTVVLRLADVSIGGVIAAEGLRQIQLPESEREKYRLSEGDLLAFRVNGSPHITGQVIAYSGPGDFAFCDHFIRFRIRDNVVLPKFVAYAFRTTPVRSQVTARMVSTAGQNTVSQGTFADVELPLAPLPEQTRIVDAIETQLTRLDAAVAALERVQANLKRYRASVLKAAVEGRLVPTEAELARREGRDYEPASVLLERILVERRRRWEASEIAAMKAKGKAPKDDTWKAKYKVPRAPEAERLPPLPEGWIWTSLGQLAWSAAYGTSTRCGYEGSGEAVLRIPNVSQGAIDLTDLKHAVTPLGIDERDCLDVGDFLVIRTNGSRALIARAAVVREKLSPVHSFASYLIRFRLVLAEPLGRWLLAYWDAPETRKNLEASAATSAGQYNVSLSSLERQLIPLPPLAEQSRVVALLEETEVVAQRLSALNEDLIRRADRLRQSILKWAFEGKLVDQDPNDEPASVLLDRIRAEREASQKTHSETKRNARPSRRARAGKV